MMSVVEAPSCFCTDSTRGWLHVGVGHRPHLNDRGKYDHERFEPKPFRWPDEAHHLGNADVA
jgi:hypothetical protein